MPVVYRPGRFDKASALIPGHDCQWSRWSTRLFENTASGDREYLNCSPDCSGESNVFPEMIHAGIVDSTVGIGSTFLFHAPRSCLCRRSDRICCGQELVRGLSGLENSDPAIGMGSFSDWIDGQISTGEIHRRFGPCRTLPIRILPDDHLSQKQEVRRL